MRFRAIVSGAAAAVVTLAFAGGTALARNPHCAGGIQYVVQALRDKEKGNLEDYRREMNKAVDQLNQCSTEDPADFEAIAYLGWAYAEIDSAALAGQAFDKAIAGLKAKDPKKVEWATQNRESYWAKYFNEGIGAINAANGIYPDYTKAPANDAEKAQREEAAKKLAEATVRLTKASEIKPNNPVTMRNLGTAYAMMGDYKRAEATFSEGLKGNPGDSTLTIALRTVRANMAGSLIDQKNFDQAIQYYGDLMKTDASNPELHVGLADAYFKRAQSKSGEASKPDYKLAADEWSKASELKGGDTDLLFNAALGYNNASDWARAEATWRAFLAKKPDDTDAMSALGAALAEEKKFADGVQVLQRAVQLKPQDKGLHRQLGGVYAKAGNNAKSYEHMVVFLAMDKGKKIDKATTVGGTDAAATLAAEGAPDEVWQWEADGEKYETWVHFAKGKAFTFKGGKSVVKTNWTAGASTASKK